MSSSQGGSVGSGVGQISAGYIFDPNSIRDSSDWTRRKKERVILWNYFGPPPKVSDPVYLVRGNQFRLSYLFARFKCGTGPTCEGGAFNGIVPIQAGGLPT